MSTSSTSRPLVWVWAGVLFLGCGGHSEQHRDAATEAPGTVDGGDTTGMAGQALDGSTDASEAPSSGPSAGAIAAGNTSGQPRDVAAEGLPTADLDAFCDWLNARAGGYGLRVNCGDDIQVATDANQRACELEFRMGCPATVGEIEDCANALFANGGMLCAFRTAPECAEFRKCAF